MNFRTLRAEEIEVRVQSVTEKGAIALIYKDARVDQNILDETVTPFGWQRKHYELKGNIYCSVGLLNNREDERSDWVWKDDAGAESNTEAVKGEASDSFKRACFNWGIGRELYSSPFIWLPANKISITKNAKGKLVTYDKFKVAKINYNDNREIDGLAISNAKTDDIVFIYNNVRSK